MARNERVAEFLARQGTSSISPGEVTALLESFLASGISQVMAIRVDWAKWRQFFRGAQENPSLQEIFASGVDEQEATGGAGDWRLKIESAPPEERETVIAQAVREIVGSVLRVKPDSLRDDQPLTDLGLDSLMGAEIENSLESAIGVGLPPTSDARTNRQPDRRLDCRSHGRRIRSGAIIGILSCRTSPPEGSMSTPFRTKRSTNCSKDRPA